MSAQRPSRSRPRRPQRELDVSVADRTRLAWSRWHGARTQFAIWCTASTRIWRTWHRSALLRPPTGVPTLDIWKGDGAASSCSAMATGFLPARAALPTPPSRTSANDCRRARKFRSRLICSRPPNRSTSITSTAPARAFTSRLGYAARRIVGPSSSTRCRLPTASILAGDLATAGEYGMKAVGLVADGTRLLWSTTV